MARDEKTGGVMSIAPFDRCQRALSHLDARHCPSAGEIARLENGELHALLVSAGSALAALREQGEAGGDRGRFARLSAMIETLAQVDRQRAYALTASDCVARLSALEASAVGRSGAVADAAAPASVIRLLRRCTDPTAQPLQAPLDRLMDRGLIAPVRPRWVARYVHLALAGSLGEACPDSAAFGDDIAESAAPIHQDEFTLVRTWPLSLQLAWAMHLLEDVDDRQSATERDDCLAWLAQCPGYGTFAQRTLQQAAERLTEIHDGRAAYVADKAFDGAEVAALARASRYALRRDEAWMGEVMSRLLPGVSVAPTSAKTVPSQALAFDLARAIAACPTPEAIDGLREANRVVRHAALAKRLRRELAAAERELAHWPARALRMATHAKLTRSQRTTLLRALEGFWRAGMCFTFSHWRSLSRCYPGLRPLFASLVWRATSDEGRAVAFIPIFRDDGGIDGIDAHGERLAILPETATVALWHPVRAGAEERQAWQRYAVERRLVQPFPQIWRTHFIAPASDAFSPYPHQTLSVKPFAGLARQQGWVDAREGGYERSYGAWRLVLSLSGRLVPGATGTIEIASLRLVDDTAEESRPASFAALPPCLASEMLRDVDLLVSATTVAETPPPTRPSAERERRGSQAVSLAQTRTVPAMTRLRRDALGRLFAGRDDAIVFDGHYARRGEYAVHLGTGVVFRAGERIEFDVADAPRSAQLPWLPYDEALLERIAMILIAIGARIDAEAPSM